VASDITNTINARLRIAGSTNKSIMVKRESALSPAVSAVPPRTRAAIDDLSVGYCACRVPSAQRVIAQRFSALAPCC
jgi:hypothetical protein